MAPLIARCLATERKERAAQDLSLLIPWTAFHGPPDPSPSTARNLAPHWKHLELLLPKSGVARTPATPAAKAIAYTQTTCSTGAMPTPQSSANTMDKPCSPTWQAFTPTQPHNPGNKS